MEALDVAVVGAGPFGLSIAATAAPRRRVRVFGEPMRTWRTMMPPGMRLRSDWEHTNLSGPGGAGSLDEWVRETGGPRQEPIPLEAFLRYADWFRGRFVPELDPTDVVRLERGDRGFRLTTDGGEVEARRVVLAVGVTPFLAVPEAFSGLEDERVAFATQVTNGVCPAGSRVAVVGAGQSAVETAARALDAGAASVELLARSTLHWFAAREPYTPRGELQRRLYRLAYPVVGFGPPGLNRVVLHPDLFARMPAAVRTGLNRRLLRAGASTELRNRLEGEVRLSEHRTIRRVEPAREALELVLDNGERRAVDRVILATGYRFDLDRLTFIAPEVRAGIRVSRGWPVLDARFRSTDRDVFFVGYAAEDRFGPLSRYVEGTRFAAGRCASAL